MPGEEIAARDGGSRRAGPRRDEEPRCPGEPGARGLDVLGALVGPVRTVSYNHTTGWTPVAASKVSAATYALEFQAVTKQVEACCSSPGALGYWFIVSLIAWGVLSLIGIYWRPLHASPAAACFGGMAIGCLANWHRNRSFHCAITGPLFLIAGVVFLLSGERMIHFNTLWVWRFVLIGVGIAFLLEWRYAKRSPS